MQSLSQIPDAQLALWNSEVGRLSSTNGFTEIANSLFGVWGLMEKEIDLLKKGDVDFTGVHEHNLKLLLSEARWNQQTAFRQYLGAFFKTLQHHAQNPMQVQIRDREALGLSPAEYELFALVQKHVPNNIQSLMLDRTARLLLALYWTEAARASSFWVPGFLLTLLSYPVLFFYRSAEMQRAVKCYLEFQNKIASELRDEVTDAYGWKIEGHSLVWENILDRLGKVYLNLSSINEKNGDRCRNKARQDLQWIINFWSSNENGTHRCLTGKFVKTDTIQSVKDFVSHAALTGAWPLQYALMSHLTLLPYTRTTIVASLPPWSSFWHDRPQHPYLDLVDSSMASNLLVRQIDFSKTLFHRRCRNLMAIIDHLSPDSPAFRVLRTTGDLLSSFQHINDNTNNACGTGLCAFLGGTIAVKYQDNNQTIAVVVTALSAAGAQIVPKTIDSIVRAIEEKVLILKDKTIAARVAKMNLSNDISILLGQSG